MSTNAGVRALSQPELADLVRWFEQRMPMDMRRALMAELPQHYRKLTGADPAAITDRVRERLEAQS